MGEHRTAVVIGQGYVGLPLAVAAATAGHQVTGVDLDKGRVDELNEGRSAVADVPDATLQAVLAAGRYRAASDFEAVAHADVVVLCVPTPYGNDAPDLSHVKQAAERVGTHLQAGTVVILESTTYPGTTEEVLVPALEQASNLVASRDFDVAFSPERIDPGNERFTLRNTPKIVGGLGERGADLARAFYASFVESVVEVSSPKTAEMAKLLENTFRHINIALVNELAVLCQDLGVDIWEVIDAAASKPFGFMSFYPGPGVGGHCIPVDPMYLSWRVRQLGSAAKFIELARDVNDAMPLYCVTRVQDLLNQQERALKGSSILVLGVAYKRNTPDMREAPALRIIDILKRKGADVRYHDPHVPVISVDGCELRSVPLTGEGLAGADCVVVLTDHDAIQFSLVTRSARLVFDTRNALPVRQPHVHRL